MYSKQDYDRLKYFRGITSPSGGEVEEIWQLWQKYVHSGCTAYRTSCGCSCDIVTLYWELMGWYGGHEHEFEK
jgi:hypothetical protein